MQAALDQTLYILRNRPAGNCSARPHHTIPCTSDEPMFQAKLVANLANYTNNRTLFCDHVSALWLRCVPKLKTLAIQKKALCTAALCNFSELLRAQLWTCAAAKSSTDHIQGRASNSPKRRPHTTSNGGCSVASCSLNSVYTSAQFKDDLVWTGPPRITLRQIAVGMYPSNL